MQHFCLVRRSSSDGSGGLGFGLFFFPIPARKRISFSWIGFVPKPVDRLAGGVLAVATATATAAASGGTDPDHYAVLGIRQTATASEVKHAYRRLAREHHPDVNRNQEAGEIFKKIHLAYEVLSDEVKRARYDLTHKLPLITNKSRRKCTLHPSYDQKLNYKWEELQRMRQKKSYYASWSYETGACQDPKSYVRRPFVEVFRFAFSALFFMLTIGSRASLTLLGISALLDKHLDVGYKMGYVIAWIVGGRAGILLALGMYFVSWLCGKSSSSIFALLVVALWVGANITRFLPLPLPQGAILTLIYMSMKLQVDWK
ncbi:hypothetical protein KSP39_PZI002324 [Platanthera zijinensis]|uniref:J domain-containing protein n=1 Tax=Platanthera zijinensis TaxID=2320716 RepID=A0AAP0BXJ8_9ASPA